MRKLIPLWSVMTLLLLFTLTTINAQSGCLGCVVDLPALPADTIYLGSAPDGQQGQPYDGDISFRMPLTTTPVAAQDSTVLSGFPIQTITIQSVSNLPPGMEWQPSQFEFDTAENTDGCVKLCGTPLQAGYYEVLVSITAQVLVLTQESTFTFPIYIAPGTSFTDGFSITGDVGCGSLEANFHNNVPSDGADGFEYFWDFGNGNISIDENPGPVLYDEPGTYEVYYQAVVDTGQYYLTNVLVSAVSCTDIFSAPDIKIVVYDPQGAHVYTAPDFSNTNPPLSFDLYVPIGEGSYRLEVVDLDGGIDGSSDVCGVFNFNRFTEGELPDGETVVELNIAHQVDTVLSVDTITVYPNPDEVIISHPDAPYCAGSSVELSINPSEYEIEWFRDSILQTEENTEFLEVTQSGEYFVVITTENGCSTSSEVVEINFSDIPETTDLINDNNLIVVTDPTVLPDDFVLRWYLDNEQISGEFGLEYCAAEDGVYTLEVTDLETFCSNSTAIEVVYDSDYENCTTNSIELDIEKITVSPNPTRDMIAVSVEGHEGFFDQWRLYNGFGQLLANQPIGYQNTTFEISMDAYPTGLYYLFLEGKERYVRKVVKE